MSSLSIPVLLLTANVGSIFEEPSQMLKIWTEEFLSTVSKLDPKFIALHCQEVGGKNYENSMKHVEHFVKLLMSSNELRLFDKVRVFLDEDYSSAAHFTALGNLYFIHESLEDILIWDFKDFHFVPVTGKEIHSGNIETVVTKEKAKFPQDFFPECKWSRKGFLRTRWSLNGTVVDLINIHLFHDASNFVAMESFPSVYCKNRRRALEHTLQRFHNDVYGTVPYFLFGDFNFRTDTESVIKKLTKGLNTVRIQNNKNNEYTKLQYTNEASELILTVGKKEFNHSDHHSIFFTQDPAWLKQFDKELQSFDKYLTEYPITFPPSYPYEEKVTEAKSFMQTRCPAWCDRVLLSHTAKSLVNEDSELEYNLMGLERCMGDHKPVYLRLDLKENSGIVKCCSHAPYECLPATCQCCQLYASVTINVVDMSVINTRDSYNALTVDSKLLHEPITRDMLSHEPYTPESADSRSPFAEKADDNENESLISPELLKDRLTNILNCEEDCSPKVLRRSVSRAAENGSVTPLKFIQPQAMPELCAVKLCSSNNLNKSSHHSSSDEEWFDVKRELQKSHDSLVNGELFSDIRTVEENKSLNNILRKYENKKRNKLSCCVLV